MAVICKDCASYRLDSSDALGDHKHLCMHPVDDSQVDVVTGEKIFKGSPEICKTMRTTGACGPNGSLFELKPV